MQVFVTRMQTPSAAACYASAPLGTPVSRGALSYRVIRAVDDANTVLVVCGFRSAAGAGAFRDDPELTEKVRWAGVTSVPHFEMYHELESAQA
jgi:hypothetical protein